MGELIRQRGIEWTHYHDQASIDLIEDKPGHGCDLCSRYRRRAVYDVARQLGANVIALGHTADDACESLLRNAMYNGRLSALPAVVNSRKGTARIIRPLIYVTEEITRAFAEQLGMPIVPCVCSFKSNTVRGTIRDVMAEPGVKQSLLAALGNIDAGRLLDPRFLSAAAEEAFPILT